MTQVDLPLSALHEYRPEVPAPEDFDDFWARTLAEARRHPMTPRLDRVDGPLRLVDVDDVTFPGFDGDPVRAWLVRPAGATGRLPVIVEFNGYGGAADSRTSGWPGPPPGTPTCSWTPAARAPPGAAAATPRTRTAPARPGTAS